MAKPWVSVEEFGKTSTREEIQSIGRGVHGQRPGGLEPREVAGHLEPKAPRRDQPQRREVGATPIALVGRGKLGPLVTGHGTGVPKKWLGSRAESMGEDAVPLFPPAGGPA